MCNILAKCRPGLQNRQTDRQTDDVCVHANAIQRKRGKGKGRGLREVSQLQLLFCNNVLNLCQAAPKKNKQQQVKQKAEGKREKGAQYTHRDTVTDANTHTDTIEAQSRHSNRTMQLGRLLRLSLCVCVCARTCD